MANPVMFIKANQTFFNANQIVKIETQGDGTAILYYGGGQDKFVLALAATEALAMSTLVTLLAPVDVTPYLVESSLEQ